MLPLVIYIGPQMSCDFPPDDIGPPSFMFDSTGTNIGDGDTVCGDSIRITLFGGNWYTSVQFRWKIDAGDWTEWDGQIHHGQDDHGHCSCQAGEDPLPWRRYHTP